MEAKSLFKSGASGSRDAFQIFAASMISLDWLKLESSNFVHS